MEKKFDDVLNNMWECNVTVCAGRAPSVQG